MKSTKRKLPGMRMKEKRDTTRAKVKAETNREIAVVGIHIRAPMATGPDEFWQNMIGGISSVTAFPRQRRRDADRYNMFVGRHDSTPYLHGAFLDRVDTFDHAFFGIPPKEASLMNPRQRLFLETAWNALEDAGYGPGRLKGRNIGIFAGHIGDIESYLYREMIQHVEPTLMSASMPGNLSSIIPSRISYLLNLKGPSMTVDTACSSSLVAVDLACAALRKGQCDMAIAGAVRVHLLPFDNEHDKLGIESSDHETRAFDERADGSGMGEGAAAVLLKPLNKAQRDGDPIYCVIKGSATNQDGASMGITAPNPSAQAEVMIKAWRDAGIDPTTLSYLETHGTGTRIGDPIEIEGIREAFSVYTDRRQFCAIGSLKTNIGHLYDCAGLAGLIKAALALQHRQIPPSLHFQTPNREIPFTESPVYVNTKLKPWESSGPRRCGVSSFGLSGTNCHIVLEEFVEEPKSGTRAAPSTSPAAEAEWIVPLSAKSVRTLRALFQRMRSYAAQSNRPAFVDLAYTLSVGRDHHPYRASIVSNGYADLIRKLDTLLDSGLDAATFVAPWYGYGQITSPGEAGEEAAATGRSASTVSLDLADPDVRKKKLAELANDYIAGAHIDWTALYRGTGARKTRVPVYPFEQTRCWLTIPEPVGTAGGGLLYRVAWKEESVKEASGIWTGETVMMAGDWPELSAQLEQDGARVIQMNDLATAKEEDYEQLALDVKRHGVSKIIHVMGHKPHEPTDSIVQLEAGLERGVFSLYAMTKALLGVRISQELDIVLIADRVMRVDGSEAELHPEASPLFGLGKVIAIEYPHLACRAIDLDPSTSVHEVAAEIRREKQTYQIAFRNGKRYAETMERVDLEPAAPSSLAVKDDGIYVITGGCGKLGLKVAQHLADKGKHSGKRIRLALVNRTPLPDRSQWETIVDANGPAKERKVIGHLLELEASGAELECVAADVSAYDQMEKVFDRLRKKYGRIRGVVHAAGVPGSGFLIRKERETLDEVIRPKIHGAWILDRLTEEDDPDWFVLFSSGVTLGGEMGQADYTAANSYLDAFADYRVHKGKTVHAINWVVWEGARMSDGKSDSIDGIFKPLPTEQALQAFDDIVTQREHPRLFVGELDDFNPEALELFGRFAALHLPDDIKSKLQRNISASHPVSSIGGADVHLRENRGQHRHVRLTGREQDDYTRVEKQLARFYQEVLGYEQLGIHDTFFELGGDSVQLHRLHRLVESAFPGQCSIADLFAYASISALAAFLTGKDQGETANTTVRAARVADAASESDTAIAIIGMSALFPGSETIEQYWDNIRCKVDCMRSLPSERREQLDRYFAYTSAGREHPGYMEAGYIDGVDEFDYRFFRLSPKEAKLTDPSQRLFMQAAWNALEDAGYGGDAIRGSRTGVYVGYANIIRDSYQKWLADLDPSLMSESIVGNVSAMMPSRLSHLLDLKGPTMVVDTACSSSLTAVHMATGAMLNGDCDAALVGGVKLFLLPFDHSYNKIGIESADGKTRAFDRYADGSGSGEGTAVIMLKPLHKARADGDRIYAVIKASALNQDGASNSITAPNPKAQTDVILQAWEKAGIHPETLAMLEAHGTGTELGDPIEISGLTHAIAAYTDKKQFCAIGSVKSNIGHLNEGAGMASIIKAALAVKHREIPPTMYFHMPNENIDFHHSPLYVNGQLRKWDGDAGQPMRCGVSSFGLSGTNCHLVIEEYIEHASHADGDQLPDHHTEDGADDINVFTLSAASRHSLERLVAACAESLSAGVEGSYTDLCRTANTGRGHYTHRIAVIASSKEELRAKLEALLARGIESAVDEGIYVGTHRIVSDARSMHMDGDLTESDRQLIQREADELLDIKEMKQQNLTAADWQQLCRLYVSGANIPWSKLYTGNYVKARLPVYPFERTKCWVDIPESTGEAADGADAIASASIAPGLYRIEWVREDLSSLARPDNDSGTVIVVCDPDGFGAKLSDRLRNAGKTVVELAAVDPDDPKAKLRFERTFQEIDRESSMQIIYCAGLPRMATADLNGLKLSQERGAIGLFLLMKAWVQCRSEHPLEVIVVSEMACGIVDQDRELIRPEQAPLIGFGKVLPKEFEHVSVRALDLDPGTIEDDDLSHVLAELESDSKARVVAYRDGKRYVERFDECEPDHDDLDGPGLDVREGGLYVITGGTGAIGLETARWLAHKARVKLALVSRSPLPERSTWDKLLQQKGKLADAVGTILELERLGSEVYHYSADISEAEDVKRVIEDVRTRGEIKGVVHAAGIVRTESMTDKSADTFRQVLGAKVYGTWLLEQATLADRLDFFLMYSSVATMFETGFQSDYLAANAYLDAFSFTRSPDGRRRLTVNWTTWKDKGMAADESFQTDTIFKTIDSKTAMKSLEKAFHKPYERVLIGEMNLDSPLALWIRNYAIRLSPRVERRLDVLKQKLDKQRTEPAAAATVSDQGAMPDDSRDVHQQVVKACRDVLGMEEIDIYENFFEMGADSLVLRRLFQKLSEIFPDRLVMADLFEYSTVDKLARHIRQSTADFEDSAAEAAAASESSDREQWLNQIFDELDEGELDVGDALSRIGGMKRGENNG